MKIKDVIQELKKHDFNADTNFIGIVKGKEKLVFKCEYIETKIERIYKAKDEPNKKESTNSL